MQNRLCDPDVPLDELIGIEIEPFFNIDEDNLHSVIEQLQQQNTSASLLTIALLLKGNITRYFGNDEEHEAASAEAESLPAGASDRYLAGTAEEQEQEERHQQDICKSAIDFLIQAKNKTSEPRMKEVCNLFLWDLKAIKAEDSEVLALIEAHEEENASCLRPPFEGYALYENLSLTARHEAATKIQEAFIGYATKQVFSEARANREMERAEGHSASRAPDE